MNLDENGMKMWWIWIDDVVVGEGGKMQKLSLVFGGESEEEEDENWLFSTTPIYTYELGYYTLISH